MIPLFKSLICPILEYGNAVWSPYLRKHIDLIESVQRHFTKCIIGCKDLEYSERINLLKLPSLEFRRLRGDLIETYKICNEIYDPVTTSSLFNFNTTDKTRTNGLKISKINTHHNQFQNFFTNRVINLWNNLPPHMAKSKSTNSFKNGCDKIFKEYTYSTNLKLNFQH